MGRVPGRSLPAAEVTEGRGGGGGCGDRGGIRKKRCTTRCRKCFKRGHKQADYTNASWPPSQHLILLTPYESASLRPRESPLPTLLSRQALEERTVGLASVTWYV